MQRLWFLLLLSFTHLYAVEGYLQNSRFVTLQEVEVEIIVDSYKNRTEWNLYIQDKTQDFLISLERYFSAEFPGPDTFTVKGRDEIYFEDPESENYGKRVGGANFWDYVGLEYHVSEVGKPALLLHEIAHYYFGYIPDIDTEEISWLIEGIVSYLPIVMSDAGFLELDEDEYNSIFIHWGFFNGDVAEDHPLIEDYRWISTEMFGKYYMKSFKLVHLLYRELGVDTFRQFVSDLYKTESPVTNMKELISFLHRYKAKDWSELFSTWVYGETFSKRALADFIDSDADEILNIDEYYFKTDPNKSDTDGDLLPDSYELAHGYDPLKVNNRDSVINIIKREGPFIDGSSLDWEFLPYYYVTESVSESSSERINMSELKLYRSEEGWNILIETEEVIERIENTFFDILVDLDGDKHSDLEYATYLDQNYAWIYDHKSLTSTIYSSIKRGLHHSAEMFIPHELLPYEKFSILPIFHNATGGYNFDEWDFWIDIDEDYLQKINQYNLQTNLLTDDRDGDLIPDIYELYHNLNPDKRDNRQTLRKLAPFIDGDDSEWKYTDSKLLKGEKKKGAYRINYLQSIQRDEKLYVMISIDIPELESDQIMFDILIDSDGDKRHDYEIAYMLHNPNYHWIYYVEDNSFENRSDIRLKVGQVIEVEIPLALLPHKKLLLLPIIRDLEKAINYDEFHTWYRVK